MSEAVQLERDGDGLAVAVRSEAGELFATEDLQRAVKTFLDKGLRPRRVRRPLTARGG